MDKPFCINCKFVSIPTFPSIPVGSFAVEHTPKPEYAKCLMTEREEVNLITGETITSHKYCRECRDTTGHCGPDGQRFQPKEVTNG